MVLTLFLLVKEYPTEAAHKCTKCKRAFSSSYMLGRHVECFHSETVFICLLCNPRKQYPNASKLAKHKRAAHVAIYKCEVCNKSFNYVGNFNKHCKKMCHQKAIAAEKLKNYLQF